MINQLLFRSVLTSRSIKLTCSQVWPTGQDRRALLPYIQENLDKGARNNSCHMLMIDYTKALVVIQFAERCTPGCVATSLIARNGRSYMHSMEGRAELPRCGFLPDSITAPRRKTSTSRRQQSAHLESCSLSRPVLIWDNKWQQLWCLQ